MSCRVGGCRYIDTHVTRDHKCGNCKEFGHGQHECGNDKLIEELAYKGKTYSMFSSNTGIEIIPTNRQCTHVICNRRKTHTIEAHHPEFEIDPIEAYFDYVDKKARKLLKERPGFYYKQGLGMGYIKAYRNNKGIIEIAIDNSFDAEDIINEFIKGYKNSEFGS